MNLRRWISEQITGESQAPAQAPIPGRALLIITTLLLGGVVVPVFGWIFGVILLWRDSTWQKRDKWIATLVLPGGFLPFTLLLASPLIVSTCVGNASLRTNSAIQACTISAFHYTAFGYLSLIILAAAPIIMALHLHSAARSGRFNQRSTHGRIP